MLKKPKLNVKTTTFLLFLLTIPAFWRMLKPGLFSMQDWHVFRLFEFEKCLQDWQIPCRWAADASFGFGQPIFNFYGQFPYLIGEFFRIFNIQLIDSLKLVFILSLVLSFFTMYLLAKQLWKNNSGALLSAIIYLYAPYRAVDVYVRGALPESLAFVFFPLIVFFFNQFVLSKKVIHLGLFTLSFSLLILTHNLSVVMFQVFFIPWSIYYLTIHKSWNLVFHFLLSVIGVFILTAFYTLPVIFESHLISLENTTSGYFDFHNHYVTLKQLFLDRIWDYGGSSWGNEDRVSLAIGYLQWILPLAALILLIFRKKVRQYKHFFIFLGVGFFSLFLTHNKSTPIWESLGFLKYIQFPWRFFSIALFSFSLATPALIVLLKKRLQIYMVVVIGVLAIGLTAPFFFEDLWFLISDKEQFSGYRFQQLIAASPYDYWPNYGEMLPIKSASLDPLVEEGSGVAKFMRKNSKSFMATVQITSPSAQVIFPVVYFPGWMGSERGSIIDIYPEKKLGLIATSLPQGSHTVELKFQNTLIRTIGNIVSLLALILLMVFFLVKKKSK